MCVRWRPWRVPPKRELVQSYWMQMTDTSTELDLRNTAVPEPDSRHLLVRSHAAALNRGVYLAGLPIV